MALSKQYIVSGLHHLGLPEGCAVMVHSALSAFGEVEGGAGTVIEALLEAIGPQGTLLMPAMASEQPFRIASSPSTVGAISEVFRSWPGAIRSLHPTHSATALGPLAEQLLAGHIEQPTAVGPESPWGRLAQRDDGYILLLGVDQDRNTLLHGAEEVVDAPYLGSISRDYIDTDGNRRTKIMGRYPGPHRDFISLDPLFEQAGIMKIGKIGSAICRLTPARQMLQLAVTALQRDPAAVLCDNPRCRDCVRQRAAIKRDMLRREDFTLSAVIDQVGLPPDDFEQALWLIAAEGIRHLEIGAQWAATIADDDHLRRELAAALADRDMLVAVYHADIPLSDEASADDAIKALDAAIHTSAVFTPEVFKLPPYLSDGPMSPEERRAHAVELLDAVGQRASESKLSLLVENRPRSVCSDGKACVELLQAVTSPAVSFAFNPAHFAQAGERPFLQTYTRGRAKRHMSQLMLTDGCAPPWPAHTLLGEGQGEVKELMSILRCRSFSGLFTLAVGDEASPERFASQAQAFWRLLQNS